MCMIFLALEFVGYAFSTTAAGFTLSACLNGFNFLFSICKGKINASFDPCDFGKVAAGQEMLLSLGAILGPIFTTAFFTLGVSMTGLEECSLGDDKHYLEAALPWFYSGGGILLIGGICLPMCKKMDPYCNPKLPTSG